MSARTMTAAWWMASLVAITGLMGCGDEASDDGAGGSGASGGGSGASVGASGGTDSGGTSSGGGTSGSGGGSGSGGASGSGGSVSGAHCATGTVLPSWQYYPSVMDTCDQVAGIDDPDAGYRDITLSAPVGPGQSFAFSADMLAPEGDFEVWGATEKCGPAQELLSTVHVTGEGVVCHEVRPANGTYTHLIWVWNTAAQQRDTALCQSGTCPSP